MAIHRAILRFFGFREADSLHVPDFSAFPQLDMDVIAKDCDIVNEAKMRGRKDLPDTDSTNYDNVEHKVINIFENEKKENIELLEKRLRLQRDEVSEIGFDSLIARMQSIPDMAIAELRACMNRGKDTLEAIKKEYMRKDDAMENFRIINKRNQHASYPDSKILQWGIITLIYIIESAANGLFLSQGHDLGLMGGIGEALVISLINVGSGYLVGSKLVPYFFHVEAKKRISALLSVFLYIAIIVIINLAVAHYRDILGTQLVDNPGREAFQKFIENPIGLDDIKSFWLFFIGLMFAGIAILDGFSTDDKYPGYGKIDRELNSTEDEYIEYKEELYAELDAIKEKHITEIQVITENLSTKQIKIQSIKERRESIESAFISHMQYLEEGCNSLLTLYRNTNTESRNTDSPEYFSRKWKFASLPDVRSIVTADQYAIDESLRNKISTEIANSKRHNKRIFKAYGEMMEMYKGVGEL